MTLSDFCNMKYNKYGKIEKVCISAADILVVICTCAAKTCVIMCFNTITCCNVQHSLFLKTQLSAVQEKKKAFRKSPSFKQDSVQHSAQLFSKETKLLSHKEHSTFKGDLVLGTK